MLPRRRATMSTSRALMGGTVAHFSTTARSNDLPPSRPAGTIYVASLSLAATGASLPQAVHPGRARRANSSTFDAVGYMRSIELCTSSGLRLCSIFRAITTLRIDSSWSLRGRPLFTGDAARTSSAVGFTIEGRTPWAAFQDAAGQHRRRDRRKLAVGVPGLGEHQGGVSVSFQ